MASVFVDLPSIDRDEADTRPPPLPTSSSPPVLFPRVLFFLPTSNTSQNKTLITRTLQQKKQKRAKALQVLGTPSKQFERAKALQVLGLNEQNIQEATHMGMLPSLLPPVDRRLLYKQTDNSESDADSDNDNKEERRFHSSRFNSERKRNDIVYSEEKYRDESEEEQALNECENENKTPHEHLLRSIPLSSITSQPVASKHKKAVHVLGLFNSQVSRLKAMKILGVPDFEVEEAQSRALGALGSKSAKLSQASLSRKRHFGDA